MNKLKHLYLFLGIVHLVENNLHFRQPTADYSTIHNGQNISELPLLEYPQIASTTLAFFFSCVERSFLQSLPLNWAKNPLLRENRSGAVFAGKYNKVKPFRKFLHNFGCVGKAWSSIKYLIFLQFERRMAFIQVIINSEVIPLTAF